MAWAKRALIKERRSVLVVEDDLDLSSIMDRILRNIDPGIHLSWATSVEGALTALRAAELQRPHEPYDLIITDIFLEGVHTGLDLWQTCRLQYTNISWVFTSSETFEKIQSSIDPNDKCPPFLPKPFLTAEARWLFQCLL
jgi:CheY-like chemotaxis protein